MSTENCTSFTLDGSSESKFDLFSRSVFEMSLSAIKIAILRVHVSNFFRQMAKRSIEKRLFIITFQILTERLRIGLNEFAQIVMCSFPVSFILIGLSSSMQHGYHCGKPKIYFMEEKLHCTNHTPFHRFIPSPKYQKQLLQSTSNYLLNHER